MRKSNMTLLCLLLISNLVKAQSVQSGIWQMDTTVEVSGIPLPASHEKHCISSVEALDIKKSLTKELQEQGCISTKWVSNGKKIEVLLKCTKSGLLATGNLRGTVNSKNYELSGAAEGTYQGIPAQAILELKGQWIKKCP